MVLLIYKTPNEASTKIQFPLPIEVANIGIYTVPIGRLCMQLGGFYEHNI